MDQHDYEQARAYLVERLTLLREMGESWQIIHTLEVAACLAALQGQQSEEIQLRLLRSARIFGAAVRLRAVLGAPVLSFQRRSYEHDMAALESQLDKSAMESAWAEGRKMTLEQIVEFAAFD